MSRIYFPKYNATATISGEASIELIDALERMIAIAYTNCKKIKPMATTDNKYLEFLHKVTLKGYEKNIMIPNTFSSFLQRCFKEKLSPEKTVDRLIEFCKSQNISLPQKQ